MPARFQLVIDRKDPELLALFWAAALGYVLEPPPEGFATWDDWRRDIGLPDSELGIGADSIIDPRGDGPRRSGAGPPGLALALSRHGLAGQRIGLWSWNSAAAIEAHLAAEWIGATRVPVDPGAPPAEAAAVFKAAGVAGVVVDTAHATDAPAGALIHDDDSPLSAAGTLEAREVQPDATHLLYPRMAAEGRFLAVPISYAN
jgi:hypothetical protein